MYAHIRLGVLVLLLLFGSSATFSQSGKVHVVKRGDTLYSLSRKYKTTVDKLLQLNPSITAQSMPVGHSLRVPGVAQPSTGKVLGVIDGPELINSSSNEVAVSNTGEQIPTQIKRINYRVEQGETFYSLSQRFAIPQQHLRELNPQVSGELQSGQVIVMEMLMFDEEAAKKQQQAKIAKQRNAQKPAVTTKRPGNANAGNSSSNTVASNNPDRSSITNGNTTTAQGQTGTGVSASSQTGSSSSISQGNRNGDMGNAEDSNESMPKPVDDSELEDIYSNPIYRPAPAGFERILIVHEIKRNEKLSDIAKKYNATKGQLISWNEEKAQEPLTEGNTLIVKIEDVPIANGQQDLPDEIVTTRGSDGKSKLADGRVVEDGVDNILDAQGIESGITATDKPEAPKKKDDGPNISRAKVSDVIYTGNGLDDDNNTRTPPVKQPVEKKEEQKKEEVKQDGPNISRARVGDVVYTGRGIGEEPKRQKTVEETLQENVSRTSNQERTAMTTLPKSNAGAVQSIGRNPTGSNPYGSYIVWHGEARVGSYIKLTNPINGESVFAKVLGRLQNTSVAVECAPKVCEQLGISFDQKASLIVEYND